MNIRITRSALKAKLLLPKKQLFGSNTTKLNKKIQSRQKELRKILSKIILKKHLSADLSKSLIQIINTPPVTNIQTFKNIVAQTKTSLEREWHLGTLTSSYDIMVDLLPQLQYIDTIINTSDKSQVTGSQGINQSNNIPLKLKTSLEQLLPKSQLSSEQQGELTVKELTLGKILIDYHIKGIIRKTTYNEALDKVINQYKAIAKEAKITNIQQFEQIIKQGRSIDSNEDNQTNTSIKSKHYTNLRSIGDLKTLFKLPLKHNDNEEHLDLLQERTLKLHKNLNWALENPGRVNQQLNQIIEGYKLIHELNGKTLYVSEFKQALALIVFQID